MSVISQVTDSLFVGNFATACNLRLLKKHAITHIVIVASGLAPRFPDQFVYLQFPAQDLVEYNLIQHFAEACEFISAAERNKGIVFVHCAMGRSRSCAVVIAYLMKSRNWSLQRAWRHLRSKHPLGNPNIGFLQQLKSYESQVFDPASPSLPLCSCAIL